MLRAGSYLAGTMLAIVATLLAAYGLRLISYSFEPSPDTMYWIIGAGLLILALPFAVAAWWSFARSPHPRGWAALALIAFGIAAASLTTSIFGPQLDTAIRLALVALAARAAVAAVRQH
jgi:peptidoglycan/LPS O-acetylase OafA/YrhL